MKMTHIEIPARFSRNSPKVLALGLENTGSALINLGNELLGYSDLSGKDILDVGCGVRFTQTIINRDIPIGSYTGIDIDEALVTYLNKNVQDSRFSFHYWHIFNELFNTKGQKLTKRTQLPFPQDKKFDVIWMYSVITHNNPTDTGFLLSILRKRYIKKDGGLLFSALIDDNIDTFEDRLKDQPLANVYYNEKFLRQIVSKTDWKVQSIPDQKPKKIMQNLFTCKPEYHFWEFFANQA